MVSDPKIIYPKFVSKSHSKGTKKRFRKELKEQGCICIFFKITNFAYHHLFERWLWIEYNLHPLASPAWITVIIMFNIIKTQFVMEKDILK